MRELLLVQPQHMAAEPGGPQLWKTSQGREWPHRCEEPAVDAQLLHCSTTVVCAEERMGPSSPSHEKMERRSASSSSGERMRRRTPTSCHNRVGQGTRRNCQGGLQGIPFALQSSSSKRSTDANASDAQLHTLLSVPWQSWKEPRPPPRFEGWPHP